MKLRQLGDSDLHVSEISLGSWLTYSGGVERDQTEACTKAAFDAGINFFDTANVYGTGAAETAWGEILSRYPRDRYILATKVFFPMGGGDQGLSAPQIHKQIDASLKRLQVEHVDLYQCHRFDVNVPIEETMGALSEVVASGKARYIGFSEWDPEQIEAGLAVPGAAKLVSSQPQYSMLWRAPEAEVFGVCAANAISQVVWSPLAEGVLSGKYKPGEAPPADSRAASDSMSTFIGRRLTDDTLEAVAKLAPIADEVGLSMTQLALAWILRRDEVASAIIGASRPEQVHENVAASGHTLSPDVLEAIDAALGDIPITGQVLAPGASAGVRHAE
jgi:aryl-alcohol dehydrogenase-like predicted oxidoreductase